MNGPGRGGPSASWARRVLQRWLPDDPWSREFLDAVDEEVEGAGRPGRRRRSLRVLASPRTAEFVWRMRVRRRGAAGRRRPGSEGGTMERWILDVRQGLRGLAREARFTAFVVVTLALGIGANAALWGVADRLFLRGPSHVEDPASLVRLFLTLEDASGERRTPWIPYLTARALQDEAEGFDDLALYRADERLGVPGEDARPLRVAEVGPRYFTTLGASPRVGRWFGGDGDPAPEGTVVLSHALWTSAYSRDPGVIGRSLRLDGRNWTVVGVAPEGFSGPQLDAVDVWIPLAPDDAGSRNWYVVARLPSEGGEPARARALAAAESVHRRTDPGRFFQWAVDGRLELAPVSADDSGARPPEVAVAALLLAVSVLVLFIGIANVGNLLLARLARRRRDVAVRLALGIGRGRLATLLLTEHLLLAGAAALLALGVAWGVGTALRRLLLPGVAWSGAALSWPVVVATLGAALAAGVGVSLLPLRQAGRADVVATLRSGGRGESGARPALQFGLVVMQVTLSAVLLAGAGLFFKSFRALRVTDLGIDADRITAVTFREAEPGAIPSPSAEEFDLHRRAAERLAEAPGVESVGVVLGLPFVYGFGLSVAVPGRDSIPELPGGGPWLSAVSAGYFEASGTGLIEGRSFTPEEVSAAAPVVIVGAAMARTLWPGGDALGSCLHVGSEREPCSRVVGVAEDVHRSGYREPPSLQYYVPLAPGSRFGGMALVVRGPAGGAVAPSRVREILADLDPAVGWVDATLLSQVLEPQVRPWRLGSWVLGPAAAVALMVSLMGVYGVLSYTVERRRREMGIRMALGASGSGIRRLVLVDGLTAVGLGLAGGLALLLLAGRWVQPLLFETRVSDPWVLAPAAAFLLAAAAMACLAPAGRAARVEPVRCLQEE